MKRILAILLSCAMLLSGCSASHDRDAMNDTSESTTSATDSISDTEISKAEINGFEQLSDPELLSYVEENIYSELLDELNTPEYFVENVSAIYLSDEYLEEVAYNSQANIYFGYTLDELNEFFQGQRYVFSLGNDGQTVVQPFEAYENIYERVVQNVAIGTGVILVCVTVSLVAAPAAPAVSMIFAASAKSGTVFALASGALGSVAAGVVTGIQTGDLDKALDAAALAGSEAFKWGAISGVLDGGVSEAIALKGATLGGLTMNEAAVIQQESKLPLEFIRSFHSVDEYNVYKEAGLQLTKVNGQWAFVQDIDWNFTDELGRTNVQRVEAGLNPIDLTGRSYEVHHIGQKQNSPLAILTSKQHRSNYSILHTNTGSSVGEVDHGVAWQQQKQAFWNAIIPST